MPRGSYSERLQYQLTYRVDKSKFPTVAEAKDAQRRAVKHFLRTGKSIAGVTIIARWRNPDNKNPRHSNWKTTEDAGQSLSDFWSTLHKSRGALRGLTERYGE
jgi:hypothetical protein